MHSGHLGQHFGTWLGEFKAVYKMVACEAHVGRSTVGGETRGAPLGMRSNVPDFTSEQSLQLEECKLYRTITQN